jgi:elongation factor 1-gamma
VAGLTIDEAANFVFGETNKTPEYKAKFASGKIPAFETKDGFRLFEGSAIARYSAPHICIYPQLI